MVSSTPLATPGRKLLSVPKSFGAAGLAGAAAGLAGAAAGLAGAAAGLAGATAGTPSPAGASAAGTFAGAIACKIAGSARCTTVVICAIPSLVLPRLSKVFSKAAVLTGLPAALSSAARCSTKTFLRSTLVNGATGLAGLAGAAAATGAARAATGAAGAATLFGTIACKISGSARCTTVVICA